MTACLITRYRRPRKWSAADLYPVSDCRRSCAGPSFEWSLSELTSGPRQLLRPLFRRYTPCRLAEMCCVCWRMATASKRLDTVPLLECKSYTLKRDRPFHIGVSPAIGHGFIYRFSIQRYNLEGNTRLRFDVVAWRDMGEPNLPLSRVQWSPNARYRTPAL
jgi:hypothetical protein